MTAVQKGIKVAAIAIGLTIAAGIISSMVSAAGFLLGLTSDRVEDDITLYSVSGDVSSMRIKIGAADMKIKESDTFKVESNLKDITVENDNGCLTILEEDQPSASCNDAVLTVYIPKDFVFSKLNIDGGAGSLYADKLSADIATVEFSAGEVNIKGGELGNLRLSMGMGELNIFSRLHGRCNLDLGIGETNLTIFADKMDYELDINRGIGSVKVDGKDLSDAAMLYYGENLLEVNGGVGSVNIVFKNK